MCDGTTGPEIDRAAAEEVRKIWTEVKKRMSARR
jgi:hypothetical protein